MDIEREEGEMSDDIEMLVEDKPTSDYDNECTLLYKADKSGVVFQKLEKIDASKLDERAKRFGLNLSGNRIVTQKQIDELYTNCGIESGNERHFRFDALYLYGIEGLNTKEIFEYLEDYKPVSLEWIDNNSCNVVCQDHISAALALLVHSREIENNDLKEINSKYHWREGMPHSKVDMILMRFATNSDKKVGKKRNTEQSMDCRQQDKSKEIENKNPWGDLCKSWGIYDHQEIFQRKLPKNDYEEESEETSEVVKIKNSRLAMRLGKRSHHAEDNKDTGSDSEWKKKSKTPRMRMHADDEESKNKKKSVSIEPPLVVADCETYAPLSIEVANTNIMYTPRDAPKLSDKFRTHTKPQRNTQSQGVRSRLGSKVKPTIEEFSSSDESSSENSEYNEQTMSRVQKIDNNLPKSSVWSRLEEKHTDQQDHRDLRHILKSKKNKNKTNDLRGRLGKLYKTNLRIEIDNDVLK